MRKEYDGKEKTFEREVLILVESQDQIEVIASHYLDFGNDIKKFERTLPAYTCLLLFFKCCLLISTTLCFTITLTLNRF